MKKPGRNGIYPWDIWTDGEVHQAVYNEDFTCMPTVFVQALRNRATKDSLRISVELPDPSTVRFQYSKKDESDDSNPSTNLPSSITSVITSVITNSDKEENEEEKVTTNMSPTEFWDYIIVKCPELDTPEVSASYRAWFTN